MNLDAEALVVGGGPVGLFLALSLLHEGVDVRVIERAEQPRAGSRSIGVHPPSIELFDEMGLSDRLIERGVRVRRGRAFGADGALGVVDFSACPAPHRYVLAVPQDETERVLREALSDRAPGALTVGEARSVQQDGRTVTVGIRAAGRDVASRAAVVIGCDGKRSAVRAALDIPFDGATYPGTYAMADFPDETALGDDAAIYLDRAGLVESFPLPHRVRRWVARVGDDMATPAAGADETVAALAARVGRRCGASLDVARASRPSLFRAERRLARTLSAGRVALAGDAAHVVSPIGGQGMNLGWMGARLLASDLATALRRGGSVQDVLTANGSVRKRVARAAARRAELNMWLGRPGSFPVVRDLLLRGLLHRPLVDVFSRLFTMRGLALGV